MTLPAPPKPPTDRWFALGVLLIGGLIALGALQITHNANDTIRVIEAVVVLVTVILGAWLGGSGGSGHPGPPGD